MKPFELHKAQCGEPIVTRDGEPAKFIAYEPEARDHQRFLYLVNGTVFSCDYNGKYRPDGESPLDLFMAGAAVRDHIPTSEYYSMYMNTTNHVQYAIEVEHLVREHCAKIAEEFPFSPNIGREIARRIREAANG